MLEAIRGPLKRPVADAPAWNRWSLNSLEIDEGSRFSDSARCS